MRLGEYRVLTQVGAGRDGATLRAQRSGEGTPVEIRTLEWARADAERWRRLVEQVRLAARLDEPSARRIRELRLESEPPFVVLEWLEGKSLAEGLRDRVPLPMTEAAALALALAAALTAAHRLGLHGQLRCHKLRLDGESSLKVDLTGIDGDRAASELDDLLDASCRAPEATASSPPTPAADVYGLGVLLNWMLFGCPLRSLSSQQGPTLLDEAQLAEREFFRPLIQQMLAEAPAARPVMAEIRDRLAEQLECLLGRTVEAPPALAKVTAAGVERGLEANCDTRKPRVAKAPEHAPPPSPSPSPLPQGEGRDRFRPVQILTRPGLTSKQEVEALLQRRLRFLSLVFVALYVAGSTLRALFVPLASWSLDSWTVLAALVVLAALAWRLWRGPPLSLRQLRAIELVLFATLAGRFAVRGYAVLWASGGLAQVAQALHAGQAESARRMLAGLAFQINLFPALCVVAYGLLVPNTWRRCLVVVAVLAGIPAVIWPIACLAHGLSLAEAFPFEVLSSALQVGLAAALAVYGSHRIDTLRHEALAVRRLGQYVLHKSLGSGGMGEVYLADHVLLRRPCAIKIIRPERAGDPAMLERFAREVQATATLTHPNAVQIFDYGQTDDGIFYYVMEYLPGLTAEELVERHGPVPPERALHFLRQLCGALDEAHAIGLIHRDIKPSNLMICERGRIPDTVKLLDFGLVQTHLDKPGDARLTREGTVLGTPAYLSPEQAGGGDIGAGSDIYSVGAVAYFLLTGQPPFGEQSSLRALAAHLYETPQPLRSVRPDMPADLEAIVLRCLAKKPADRFPDVDSLAAALAACDTPEPWTGQRARDWWASCGETTARVNAESNPQSFAATGSHASAGAIN